jgi:hypothetical protein
MRNAEFGMRNERLDSLKAESENNEFCEEVIIRWGRETLSREQSCSLWR